MASFSKNDVILVRYPFSDLSASKVRPAVVVSAPHESQDLIIVPLTSRTSSLLAGEFPLTGWRASGLNVSTAVKRGLYTVHEVLIIKTVGRLIQSDAEQLERSLREWLGLP
jgi:mRNA interferase MazF